MTLSTTISSDGIDLDIRVDYNEEDNTVDEIISCKINGENITALLVTHFEPCLNKLIDSVDWRELARREEPIEQ